MADRIQQRRDTAARWEQYNPVLLEGEVGYVTDNPNRYKIGDGIHAWNDLPLRGYTGTIVQDTGNDENAVMSQKATTDKFTELQNRLDYFNPTVSISPATTYTINTALQKLQKAGVNVSTGFRLGFTNSKYKYEEWRATSANIFEIDNWVKQTILAESEFANINNNISVLKATKANLWNPTKQVSPATTYTISTALQAARNNGIVVNSGDKIGFTNHDYIYEEWLCKNNGSYNISDWEKVCVRYTDLDKLAKKDLYGYINYDITIEQPTNGIDNGNKYTLKLAASLVPQEFRNVHTRLIFLNAEYKLEEWVCTNDADWLNTSSDKWLKTGVIPLKKLQDLVNNISNTADYPILLSNNTVFNSIIKELYIKSIDLSSIEKVYIYKGFNNAGTKRWGLAVKTSEKTYYYSINKDVSNNPFYQNEDLYAVINWSLIENTRYETPDGFSFNPILNSDISNFPIISQHLNANEEVDIVIGDKIFAVVGDRLQLFHKGIFNCANLSNYIVRIECSKGKSYPRYFEYTPTSSDVGEVDITFNIYKPSSLMDYTGVLLASKKSKLVTVNTKSSPSTLKRILMIGDSTITAGVFQNEAFRRLTANDGTPAGMGLSNIKMLGRKTSNKYGVIVGYEGTSGWSWNNYIAPESKTIKFNVTGVTNVDIDAIYTVQSGDITLRMLVMETNIVEGAGYIRCAYNSDSPSYSATPNSSGTMKRVSGSGDSSITYTSIKEDNYSPFCNSNTSSIDIKSYVDEYCEGNIDYFVCVLGINSISQMFSSNKTVSTIIQEVKTLIDAVHDEFPSVKIMIATIPMPSQNGGAGASFNASYRAVKEDYERRAKNINTEYIKFALKDEYSSFVSIINLSAEFDCDYLYPTTEVAANPRTTEKEVIGTSSSHPSTNGYLSEGDCIFRYLYGII